MVAFVVAKTERWWVLALNDDVPIGRVNPDNRVWPVVDLTEDKNAVNRVSRKHAILRCSEHGPVLMDLNSSNGTLIK